MGSGGASSQSQVEAADILRERGVKRVGPYRVTQTMGSTVSANLATAFQIKGVNYSMSSACSTSLHCMGNAMEQIQLGKQDIVFAGGGEEEHWTLSCLFDAMGALSSKYNDTPSQASRAYDANRDGFVIAGGGGALVLEEYEHAKARGATIYAQCHQNRLWIQCANHRINKIAVRAFIRRSRCSGSDLLHLNDAKRFHRSISQH